MCMPTNQRSRFGTATPRQRRGRRAFGVLRWIGRSGVALGMLIVVLIASIGAVSIGGAAEGPIRLEIVGGLAAVSQYHQVRGAVLAA